MKWNKVVKNYLEAFIVCEQCEHCGDIVCYCPETEIQTNNSQACSGFYIFLLLSIEDPKLDDILAESSSDDDNNEDEPPSPLP